MSYLLRNFDVTLAMLSTKMCIQSEKNFACVPNVSPSPDSSTVPKYPQVSLVKILEVGCYFRDCEIRTRKVANSKTCNVFEIL